MHECLVNTWVNAMQMGRSCLNSIVLVCQKATILHLVTLSASEYTQSIHIVQSECFVNRWVKAGESIDELFDHLSSSISQMSRMNIPNEYEYISECDTIESNMYE